ncbi:MAG TPA: FRG domain-containing protein [Bacteroidia bacterium]|jgi:hypothetical protein|nr:FRG domain-containing protein [Bacteroidia bacterium]
MELIHKTSINELKSYMQATYIGQMNQKIPKYLFRGQTKSYGSFQPNFARLAKDRILRGQAQTLYSWSRDNLRLNGYRVNNPKEAVAVLQHYGLPTPQIDLTGNIDVAIYFATENLDESSSPRIYVIDTTNITEDLELTEHFFFLDTIDNNGHRNRWLRQDGYAIMPQKWTQADEVNKFDLYSPEYSRFLSCITFDPIDKDNILYECNYIYKKDEIQSPLKFLINSFCKLTFGGEIHSELARRIQNIDIDPCHK